VVLVVEKEEAEEGEEQSLVVQQIEKTDWLPMRLS